MSTPRACPAGHEPGPRKTGVTCSRCRWDTVVAQVGAADQSLASGQVAAAVDAAAGSGQALRSLAAALAGQPIRDVLADGAPPVAGRGRRAGLPGVCRVHGAGLQVLRGDGAAADPLKRGGVCSRCRNRLLATACVRCGTVKPVACRTGSGQPVCERCRRHERGHRRCGTCGKTAPIAVRGRGGHADVCVNCYRMPQAVCTACGRRRPCSFADGGNPVCKTCAPRATSFCARCGLDRPPAAHWPEGPVCDTCYTSALRRRGACAACRQERRLIAPPGPGAIMCADCAGLPLTHLCALCGAEDKLFEKGRCARCSLRGRASDLMAGAEAVPGLTVVAEAIAAARNPYSALNWLRTGGAAVILAEVAAGRTALTHQALDVHPNRRAADYLRHMLTAGGALPARDEALARVELWSREVLGAIGEPADRRLVQAYLTWRVLRRLRHRSETSPGRRTVTNDARHRVIAVVTFLAWLRRHDLTLASCGQGHVETWLATGPAAYDVRDFLAWAGDRKHCAALEIPGPQRKAGTAASPNSGGSSSTACSMTRPSTSPTGPPAACCCCSASTCHGPP